MNTIKSILAGTRQTIKLNWKIYVGGMLTIIVIISILLAIPVKKVTLQSKVTSSDTEKVIESYTELEPYIAYNDNNSTEILINGFYKVVPNGTIVPFTIENTNSRVIGHFENSIPGRFAILGIGDRVIWETMGSRDIIDLPLKPGEYKAMFKEDVMWGEDCYIFMTVQWGESEPVIEYKEVTKYHEVEIPVEKQDTVEKEVRISTWNYLFWKLPVLR
jgi:hypothetical protein